jgi:hypothetical protein
MVHHVDAPAAIDGVLEYPSAIIELVTSSSSSFGVKNGLYGLPKIVGGILFNLAT